MVRREILSLGGTGFALGLVLAMGCGAPPRVPPEPTIPLVSIAQLIESDNIDYEDFTGRVEAIDSVDIKARATGYLDKVMFSEGDIVKEGQQLYQIDDRTYKANLDKYQSDINRYKAQVDRANADLLRARQMRIGDAISRQEYDRYQADRDEGIAQLSASKASAEKAKLDLEFTKVFSPVTGKISKTKITRGNLVNADTTSLTNVVSVTPIYAYFDVDERSVLRIQQMIREEVSEEGIKLADEYLGTKGVEKSTIQQIDKILHGKVTEAVHAQMARMLEGKLGDSGGREFGRILRDNPKFKSYRDRKVPLYLGTQIEEGFPHEGYIDFVDNRIDPGTGTLRVRGKFENKSGGLQPGMFVRIRLPIGEKRKAVLVSERALGSDQGQRFLYVVNDKDMVEYRAVEVGSLRDGFRVLESGAQVGEWVIVNGLQRVRPGIKVEPKKVPMPGTNQPGLAAPGVKPAKVS